MSDAGIIAGSPKTGAWRDVVAVRHFVALRDESDALVGCSTRKIADSGAGLPERFRRSAILARDLAQIKSADNQQVQTNREIVRLPVRWEHSQLTGAVKGCNVYNSQPLPQYLRPGIFAEALPVKWQPSPDRSGASFRS